MSMSYWQEKITIGNKSYSRFIGGPLDGITDSPFRQLVREFSPDDLMYTEMRHVACIANDRGGKRALKFLQSERPLNYQVAANKVEYIQPACEKIVAAGVDMVDLNVGCPARNVIGSGSGSALMADLPRLIEIVKTFKKVLPATIPFTVKIRAGFKEVNALEVAKALEDHGADALAIHPRLQTQRFEGRPDYALVAQVKKALTIPVIVSGGIINFKMAKMVYEQTGVDGYLIGRGIWSKPWKLHELALHATNQEFTVTKALMLTCALKHLDLMLDYYGARGLYNFRKHVPFYLRGMMGASQLRNELVTADDPRVVKERLQSLLSTEG